MADTILNCFLLEILWLGGAYLTAYVIGVGWFNSKFTYQQKVMKYMKGNANG